MAAAATTCSDSQLGSLKGEVSRARDRWRSSYSAADHAAYVAARNAAVSYAGTCVDALGGNLTELLRGAVPVPYYDVLPNGPQTHAPGDTVDLFIQHVPTSLAGTAGTTLTYSLLVANQGAEATTPILTDFLFADESPSPTVTVTATSDPSFGSDSCTSSSLPGSEGGLRCELGENLPSQFPYRYWTIRVNVSAVDRVTLASEASVAAAEFETNNSNNTSSASLRFDASSGLSINATGPVSAISGDDITYTLTVQNGGPSVAQATVIKDFLPPETDLVSLSISSGSCSNTPGTGTITCNAGDVSSGGSRTVSITAKVKANVADGTVIFNDAQVTSETADPNNGDNVDTVATTIDAGTSGLAVNQTGPANAVAGTQVTYLATITNVGSSNANNVVVREFAPDQMEVLSIVSTSGTCNLNGTTGPSCNLGTLPPALGEFVTVTAKVRTNTPDGTTLFNTIQATSDAFESSNGDNLDTDATLIEGAVSGLNVGITGPATAVAGTPVAYDVVLLNVGPDQGTNVQLKDVIPSDIDVTGFTISQGNCGATGGGLTGTTVTCNVGTLAPSTQVNATIQGILKASAADNSVLLNTVSASGTIFESDTGDNAATASTVVDAQADLSIDTVDSADPINIDTPFRWVNTITNAGPSDATGVVVIDTIPHLVEELKVRVLPSGCDRFEETIKCSLGTIKAGASVTMNVELEAMVNAGPSISHTVEVVSLADDPNPSDNSDTETTSLQAPDMVGSFTSLTSNCDAVKKVCQAKGKFKVTNAGNAKSVQSSLRFVYSANTTLGAGDPQLKKFTINQLKPGESQELKYSLVFPIDQYLIAQVDSASQIAETNEGNNLSLKGPFPKP